MTLDTFFNKFDQFADTPDAVAKLRASVLQLAVQGKLVEQKHGDGNAKARFSDSHPEKGERRYEIPAMWLWIRFASISEQRVGKMLDQRANRGDLKPYLRNTKVLWMTSRSKRRLGRCYNAPAIFSSPSNIRARGQPKLKRIQPGQPKYPPSDRNSPAFSSKCCAGFSTPSSRASIHAR